jgi:hypothetical protein
MKSTRNQFPVDPDNRIQKLYYDININTIFNRTKLQNVKNKFWKYLKYLIKYEKMNIQSNISRLQKTCWEYTIRNIKESNISHDDGYENSVIFSREYDKCSIEITRYITLQTKYYENINIISDRIKQIKTHQTVVHKYYKKCSCCGKMVTINSCGCKSKHNLCSECIYDKTECPICNEDFGLKYCDICMEYNIEKVDTGCKNKHQICNECLQQIQKRKQRKQRVLDMNIRNAYHRDSDPYCFEYKCPFCRDIVDICCNEEEYYEWPGYDEDVVYINEN